MLFNKNKKCKKCNYNYIYIGSAQNGYMYYCTKCLYLEWAPDKNNETY